LFHDPHSEHYTMTSENVAAALVPKKIA